MESIQAKPLDRTGHPMTAPEGYACLQIAPPALHVVKALPRHVTLTGRLVYRTRRAEG
jgi:hypothetical protein